LEKQNALLYSVVIGEDSAFAKISKQELSTGIHRLEYQVSTDGVVLGEDK
jgi:hypothetical protein